MSPTSSMAIDNIKEDFYYPLNDALDDSMSQIRRAIWARDFGTLAFNVATLPNLTIYKAPSNGVLLGSLCFRRMVAASPLYKEMPLHVLPFLPTLSNNMLNAYEKALAGLKLLRPLYCNSYVWSSLPGSLRHFVQEGVLSPSLAESPTYDESTHLGIVSFIYKDADLIYEAGLLEEGSIPSSVVSSVIGLDDVLYYSALRLSALYKNALLGGIFYNNNGVSVINTLNLDPSSTSSTAFGNRVGSMANGIINSNRKLISMVIIDEDLPFESLYHLVSITEAYYDEVEEIESTSG
ncbi:hypothetical protein FOZ60_016183 [Perkinsus olseni]|uniref:Uncharacterized protein n=1 Tax=Perkinsus olseni TaxID=32597 RepID=A0A7J6N488_PEROL|nr:hypothetical protein FOZ60_016183 [Perkinsus olseni]